MRHGIPKRKLIKLDHSTHNYTQEAINYLDNRKVLELYADEGCSNFVIAKIDAGYYVSLSNADGCKSTVFGNEDHIKDVFIFPLT